MNLKELLGRFNVVAKRLTELHQMETRTDEQDAELDATLAEFNDLGPQVERLQAIEVAATSASKMQESRGRVAGAVPADGEKREAIDRRSIGKRFAESEQVQNYAGRGRSAAFEVGSFHHKDQQGPDELRALIHTGALPADYIGPQLVPGMFGPTDLQATVRDVLINGQTQSDAITFFRELLFTNAAVAVAQATATAGASGLKPESTLTFEQATAPVVTIAHWIPITRQTLEDASQIRTYVEQRLLDGLKLEESDQLLNGDGVGANMTGILATTGTQLLDAAAFVATPVADDGTGNENFNRILRAKTLIRTVGRAIANFVVLNPADMEEFLTATDGNLQYFGAGPYGSPMINTMWGLRVVEDENIAAGLALVGDGRMAAVWDRMQSQVLIDTIDDQFVRNMFTLLAEERVALTVFRPAAFAEVSLA